MFGLFILAPEFVHTVLGANWAPAIPIIKILCAVGLIRSIVTTVGTVINAKGRSDIMFKWSIFYTLMITLIILGGVGFGIVGVAYAILLASSLYIIILHITNRLIELKFSIYLGSMKWSTLSAFLMLLIIYGYKIVISKAIMGASDLFILVSGVALGAISYTLVLKYLDKQFVPELKEIIAIYTKGKTVC